MNSRYIITLTTIFFLFFSDIDAQQNHAMYLQHYLPESNLLNPAVPLECEWYIGAPLLSSIHLNAASSGFSFTDLFNNPGSGEYSSNIDNVVNKLHRRNFIGGELHLQWLALGYRKNNNSFFFTITEKINAPLVYPKNFIQLLWNGNSMFEGENSGLKGTGFYFNHYREYAFTYSTYNKSGIIYGIRAKLLFGKLNIDTRSSNLNLYTDETTFNLNISGDININTSLPITITGNNGMVDNISLDDNINMMQLLFNRKNPGFAIDAGLINLKNTNLEFSASILDLGFIKWNSNLNNFKGEGNFLYEGNLNNTQTTESYFQDLSESIVDSFDITSQHDGYISILPPRLLAGARYTINDNFDVGANSEVVLYRTKIVPSLTFSGHFVPYDNIHLLASYSFQYSSYNHLGVGIILGKNPVQFYAITDNITGLIWPLRTRNVNLRFGLNILLGCNLKDLKNTSSGSYNGNCSCYDDYRKPKRRR